MLLFFQKLHVLKSSFILFLFPITVSLIVCMVHNLEAVMEETKWEDMNPDFLANIFGRLEPKSRIVVIQLVCKPWYRTVRDPLCWKRLIFDPRILTARLQTDIIKFAASKSQRCATVLVLPLVCDREELLYVSEEWV